LHLVGFSLFTLGSSISGGGHPVYTGLETHSVSIGAVVFMVKLDGAWTDYLPSSAIQS